MFSADGPLSDSNDLKNLLKLTKWKDQVFFNDLLRCSTFLSILCVHFFSLTHQWLKRKSVELVNCLQHFSQSWLRIPCTTLYCVTQKRQTMRVKDSLLLHPIFPKMQTNCNCTCIVLCEAHELEFLSVRFYENWSQDVCTSQTATHKSRIKCFCQTFVIYESKYCYVSKKKRPRDLRHLTSLSKLRYFRDQIFIAICRFCVTLRTIETKPLLSKITAG